jgi:hypothetical protein
MSINDNSAADLLTNQSYLLTNALFAPEHVIQHIQLHHR